MVTTLLGIQWGDEGKGKLVDHLAKDFDIIVRANGGANAGHTVYAFNQKTGKHEKHVFHLLPSGMLHANASNVIANGCVIYLPTLYEELSKLSEEDPTAQTRLKISDRAHLLFEYHKKIDALQEQTKKTSIGTTKQGIGPCYADKINRIGLRACDLVNWTEFEKKYNETLEIHKKSYPSLEHDAASELKQIYSIRQTILPNISDTTQFLNESISQGKKVLCEGANAFFLDVDHGTYPFVTSSNPSIGGLITGSGMPPQAFSRVIGIIKAYTTRVGTGPFPTELENELGELLRKKGVEYGSTTGRPRRCGWLDLVLVNQAISINGVTELNLTKVDVLNGFEKILIATAYRLDGEIITRIPPTATEFEKVKPEYIELEGWEDASKAKTFDELPGECKTFVATIERLCSRPVTFIGVGPNREDIITKSAL